jgi:hypothetical protein
MEASDQLHAPAFLQPGKEPAGTHWIGGWVGSDYTKLRVQIAYSFLCDPLFSGLSSRLGQNSLLSTVLKQSTAAE